MKAQEAMLLANKGSLTAYDYEAGSMSLDIYHHKIKTQSKAGKYVLVERGKIKDDVKVQLIEEGYRVTCKYYSESDLYYTNVCWGAEKLKNKILEWMGNYLGALIITSFGIIFILAILGVFSSFKQ